MKKNYLHLITFVIFVTGIFLPRDMQAQCNLSANFTFSPDSSHAGTNIQFQVQVSNAQGPVTYSWAFGDGHSSSQATPIHAYNTNSCQPKNYTVSLNVTDSMGCTSSVQKQITIDNNPEVGLDDMDMVSDFSNCENSPSLSNPTFSLNLTNGTQNPGAVSSYQIDWGDGNSNTYTNGSFPINHTYTSLGLFNLTVTATDSSGCTWSNSYSVANQSNPAIGLNSLGATQGCAPQTFQFVLSQYQNNSPGTYYVWEFGDGSPQIVWNYNQPFINDTITHTFDTTSCNQPNKYFTVKVTAYNECDHTTATVTNIRIYQAPDADFVGSKDSVCMGTSVQFSNNTTSGFGYNCNSMASYLWDFDDPTSSNNTSSLQHPTHTFHNPGTYEVVLQASNSVCGTNTDTQEVVVYEPPKVNITADTTEICQNGTVNFSNLTTGTKPDYQWTIQPATGYSLVSGNMNDSIIEVKFTDGGTYTVNLQATNFCANDDSTITITVNKAPAVGIYSLADSCGSAQIQPSALFNANGATIQSYHWTFNGGNPAVYDSISPGTINYNSPGTYEITASATNICGTGNDTLQFNINALPQLSMSASSDSICQGESTNISVSGANTYNWSPLKSLNQSNGSQVTASPDSSTTYFVTGTDSQGCQNTDSIPITVNPLPGVQLSASSTNICPGDSIILSATGAQQIQWSPSGSLSSVTGQNVIAAPSATTTYTATGTSSFGCQDSNQITIQVHTPPDLVFSPASPEICKGDSVSISVSGAQNYTWSPFGSLSSASGSLTSASPSVSTSYSVKGTDQYGCESVENVNVKVNPLPAVSVTAGDDTICAGESVTLSGSGAAQFNWTGTNGFSGNGSSINVNPSASTTYYGSGVDTNGCSATDSVSISVKPIPTLSFTKNKTHICKGDSVFINVSGANTYSWMDGNQSMNHHTPQYSYKANNSKTFHVIGSTTAGCHDTISIPVNVHPIPVLKPGISNAHTCPDDTLTLSVSGATSYQWDPGFGLSQTFGDSVKAFPSTDTSYLISGTDQYGCSADTTISVNVHSDPSLTLKTSDTMICKGQTVQLIAGGADSYLWSPGKSLNSSVNDTVLASPMSTTTYQLTGTNIYGCETTRSITIHVHQGTQLTANPFSTSICKGDTAQLSVSGANTYIWPGSSGIVSTNGNKAQVSPTSSTSYQVIGVDSAGCMHSVNIGVTVLPVPSISAHSSGINICKGDSIQLWGSGADSYQWKAHGSVLANQSQVSVAPGQATAYTLTGTDTNGCSTNSTINVNVNPKPSLNFNIQKDTSICLGSSVNIIASGATNYSWSPSASLDTSSGNNVTASPAQKTTYYITGTSGYGCNSTDSIQLTVNPNPSVTLSASATDICHGDSAILNASGAQNFSWNHSQQMNSSLAVSPDSSHTYVVTGIDSSGCSAQASRKINVHPLPSTSFTVDSILCKGTLLTVNNNSQGASAFSWDFGDGNTSNSANPVYSYNKTGYFTIKLKAASTFGCMDSSIKSIQVIETPSSDFALSKDTGCSPMDVQFNNLSSGHQINYQWNLGNGQNSNQHTPAQTTYTGIQNKDTSYVITLTTSNKCGSNTHQDTARVKTKPLASFGISTHDGCSPLNVKFSNTSPGNPQAFLWDFGDGNQSTYTNPPNHNFYYSGNSDTTYDISLVAYNLCGTDTANTSLTVRPKSVKAVYNASKLNGCAPMTVQFSNFSTPGAVMQWDFDDGNMTTQKNPAHTFTSPGNYDVHLLVYDSCSVDSMTKTIHVSLPPTADFSKNTDSICPGESISFTNLSNNIADVSWDFGDGSTSKNMHPVHQYNQSGVYQVKMVMQEQGTMCTDSVIKPVYVRPGPDAGFSASSLSGCEPLKVDFYDSTYNANYFHFDFGNGHSSGNPSPSTTYPYAGTYTVWQKVENNYGCRDSLSKQINVHQKPNSNFTLPVNPACDPPLTIQPQNNSKGAVKYFWDFDNGQTSTLHDPSATYKSPGNYNISLMVTNMYQCKDTSIKTFTVGKPVKANFAMSKNEGCEPLDVHFINKCNDQAVAWQWDFGNAQTSAQSDPDQTYHSAGLYSVSLIAESQYGCKDTAAYNDTIKVHPTPYADFGYDIIEQPHSGTGKVEFENLSPTAQTFIWDFDDGSSDTVENPTHMFPASGVYNVMLTVFNQYGCSGEQSRSLELDKVQGLFIPNALAPEDPQQGVHTFKPKGRGIVEYWIAVYDKWGNKIWESTELKNGAPAEGWDGTNNGKFLPADVYVWKAMAKFEDGSYWKGVKGKDGKYHRAGHVTLIR